MMLWVAMGLRNKKFPGIHKKCDIESDKQCINAATFTRWHTTSESCRNFDRRGLAHIARTIRSWRRRRMRKGRRRPHSTPRRSRPEPSSCIPPWKKTEYFCLVCKTWIFGTHHCGVRPLVLVACRIFNVETISNRRPRVVYYRTLSRLPRAPSIWYLETVQVLCETSSPVNFSTWRPLVFIVLVWCDDTIPLSSPSIPSILRRRAVCDELNAARPPVGEMGGGALVSIINWLL